VRLQPQCRLPALACVLVLLLLLLLQCCGLALLRLLSVLLPTLAWPWQQQHHQQQCRSQQQIQW
jgi:hypothetical protein